MAEPSLPARPERRPEGPESKGLIYKFVELSIVTSETIEEAVNEWVRQGWTFDGIRFVTTEASRRPAMAFISFVRQADEPVTSPPSR